jgi:hypothetical protein
MIILSLLKKMFTKPYTGKLKKQSGGLASPARATTSISKRVYSPNRMPVVERRCIVRPRAPRD